MATILKKNKYIRHPDSAHRVVDGQALIVKPREARMFTLNSVGSRVWELLGDLTVAEVAAMLPREFKVDEDQALADTITFLEALLERGMVVESDG